MSRVLAPAAVSLRCSSTTASAFLGFAAASLLLRTRSRSRPTSKLRSEAVVIHAWLKPAASAFLGFAAASLLVQRFAGAVMAWRILGRKVGGTRGAAVMWA
ncbi:MAG: hypothetical protein KC502_23555 [Myxococcales bacterium]|nr:hypothetical protein [Myxococcales bacterium]